MRSSLTLPPDWDNSPTTRLIKEQARSNINDNILHFHIPKCAGVWIKSVIYDCNGMFHKFNFGHTLATVMKEKVKSQNYSWDDFHKFAVVRDPWSKLWSSYSYTKWGSERRTQNPLTVENNNIYYPKKKYLDETVSSSHSAVMTGWIENNELADTFKDYINFLYDKYKEKDSFLNNPFVPYYDTKLKEVIINLPKNSYIIPQWVLLFDLDGKTPLYNKVFKMDELNKLFEWASKINNDQTIILRSLYTPKQNVSVKGLHHYNVYDDEMINKVGEIYKKDIDLFNFEY